MEVLFVSVLGGVLGGAVSISPFLVLMAISYQLSKK